MKEYVRIIGSKTGLGNQVQFIPFIHELKDEFEIISDSKVFYDLGILSTKDEGQKAKNIVVFGYNVFDFLEARRQYKGRFYGFKYRVKGRHLGLGYRTALRFNEEISEVENNQALVNKCFSRNIQSINFSIPRSADPIPKRVVFGISIKSEKRISNKTWAEVRDELVANSFEVVIVDQDIGIGNYIATPTIKDLKRVLSTASYYIGTDSGVMHVADILNVPSLIMFGATSILKNKPQFFQSEVLSKNLPCSPCYDWGRISCDINYECMSFDAKLITSKFLEVVTSSKQSSI